MLPFFTDSMLFICLPKLDIIFFFFGDRKILMFPNSAHPTYSRITNGLYRVQKAMMQLCISSLNLLWDYWEACVFPFHQTSVPHWRAAQLPGKHASSPGQVLSAYVQRDYVHCWARSFPMWRQIPQRQTSFLIPIPSKKEYTGLLLTLLSSLATFEEKKSST